MSRFIKRLEAIGIHGRFEYVAGLGAIAHTFDRSSGQISLSGLLIPVLVRFSWRKLGMWLGVTFSMLSCPARWVKNTSISGAPISLG